MNEALDEIKKAFVGINKSVGVGVKDTSRSIVFSSFSLFDLLMKILAS